MSKGAALMIGLNSVDSNHYAGWSGALDVCENDAKDMAEIAASKGFEVKTLLTQEATRDNVIREISQYATALEAGDIFLLAYSGHGGQVRDINSDEDDDEEDDDLDETWCLYDGQLIDDEINNLFSKFAEGTRILVFSDSCFSGDIVKAPASGVPDGVSIKAMPWDYVRKTYYKNKDFYDAIQRNPQLKSSPADVNASVLQISGCQEKQKSLVYPLASNSLFTEKLRQVWDNGAFNGDYHDFCKSIIDLMPPNQTPNYLPIGKNNPAFEAQVPLTI